ncbi:MAG: FAD-binding oxidoreductase [Vicinamibacterales bacterium]
MTRTRYGVSPWALATASKSRAFPTTPAVSSADVVVVGGGLTGLLTATALKAEGLDVVLLEAARVGSGQSRAASGLTGLLLASDYRALEAVHGRRIARTLMTAVAGSGAALTAGLRKARIQGAGSARPILSLADPSVRGWDREVAARGDVGLAAAALSGAAFAKATTADALAAIRIDGGGLVHPSRIVSGAITRAAEARVKVFEKSQVARITFTRVDATVHVGKAAIVTPKVVICTDAPANLAPTLDRHVRGFERYHVLTAPLTAAMRRAVGLTHAVLGDAGVPLAVTATDDGRLLVSGADSAIPADKQRPAAQVHHTGELMYEVLRRFPAILGLRPEFGWSTTVVAGPDRFPLIGPHRQYPHQVFSFGTDQDPALAWLASRLLVRVVTGTANREDEAFGFGRVQEERH